MDKLRIAVIGAGYWGPNLVRNFRNSPDWDLVAVCDLDPDRAAKVIGDRSTVAIETDVSRLLERDDLDAVAIATPPRTHARLAIAALEAGKHVLVEKPLASNLEDARRMVEVAAAQNRALMLDHTFCYTPAVRHIRQMIADGVIGDVLFVDSVRINLGLVQPDVNVFWDLAPHDLSILDFILPSGLDVGPVTATGADPLGTGQICVGHATLPLPGGGIANISVNWLSPTKIRSFVVGGRNRTLVWDDLNPMQRVALYDRGVEVTKRPDDLAERKQVNVSYRMGDIHVPALREAEALGLMVAEFAAAIREERAPLTDGHSGMRVLSVLHAIDESLATGLPVAPQKEVTV
jgi:predicted dehydrogenase